MTDKEAIRKMVVDGKGANVIVGITKENERYDSLFKAPYTLTYMKTVYMECRDPTEYKVAMALFADWAHWKEFRNHQVYKNIVDEWKAELEIMLKSEMIEEAMNLAKSPGGFAAAKWLHDKGFEGELPKRGRPANKPEITSNPAVENKLEHVLHLVRK